MRLLRKNMEESRYKWDHGALSIDCMSCRHEHDPGIPECVRCIVKGIVSSGECVRIILRGNSDTEYYGDSVSIFAQMAEVGMSIFNVPNGEEMKKCRMCRSRPSAISDFIWSSFPETDADEIRRVIKRQEPSGKNCEECLVRTYRSLDNIEFLLNEVSKDAARCAFSLVGT